MTTALKGNTTEAAVLSALVARDFAVLVPFGEGHSYDVGVELPFGSLLRVQCKTARVKPGCISFNSKSTDHGRGPGTYLGLADIFGVYSPSTDDVYLVPVADAPLSEVCLRLEPTRNNQHRRVRFAADYQIDRWTVEALLAIPGRSADTSEPLRLVTS